MALANGVASITVEGYVRNTDQVDRSGLRCTLRIGARTFTPRVQTYCGNKRVCREVFEVDPKGEDIAVLDVVDDNSSDSDDAAGTATFSMSGAGHAGSDRLEVAVLSAKSPKQHGTLTLSITWTPAEAQTLPIGATTTMATVTTTSTTVAALSPSVEGNTLTAATCFPPSPPTSADPATTTSAVIQLVESFPAQYPPPGLSFLDPDLACTLLAAHRQNEEEGRSGGEDGARGQLSGASTTGAHFASPFATRQDPDDAPFVSPFAMTLSPEASVATVVQAEAEVVKAEAAAAADASSSVMAAMVAVAAMVAAAADLPAPPSSSSSSNSAGQTHGSQMGTGTAAPVLFSAASTTAAFYPRIKPYESAPPLEFGPGLLPTESSGAATFYPDIAVRFRIPDLSLRFHELRPTVSAPLRL